MTQTHDGIAGFWDAKPPNLPYEFSTKDDDILYLRYSTRGLMLDHELFSGVEVTGNSTATVVTQRSLGTMFFQVARPPPDFFGQQLRFMRSYADLREDRIPEISVQIDDILSFFGAIALIDDQRRLKTMELLEAVIRLCIFVELKVKHLCRAKRPVDYAPELQPIIQTPDHSTFPSGHATEAFAVATVLHRLMTKGAQGPLAGVTAQAQPFRLAARIAVNRTVAGVHFPGDTAAGAVLGCMLGEYVHRLGTGAKVVASTTPVFQVRPPGGSAKPDDKTFYGDMDFSLAWLASALSEDLIAVLPVDPVTSPAGSVETAAAPAQPTILETFWRKAQEEF